jgi:hypothetical protein
MKNGSSSSASTGKGNSVFAVLNSSKTLLKSLPGGISSTRVVEVAVRLGDLLLSIGGSKMHRHIHTAVDLLRLLTGVDGQSGESGMLERQILLFSKSFVLHLTLWLTIQHYLL